MKPRSFSQKIKSPPNKSLVFKLILTDFGDIIVFFLYQSTCITKHIWKVVLHVDIQVVSRYSITQISQFVYSSAQLRLWMWIRAWLVMQYNKAWGSNVHLSWMAKKLLCSKHVIFKQILKPTCYAKLCFKSKMIFQS